jgi:hypothetical protein
VTRLKWTLVLVRLEILLILTQHRCIVYAERTIGSKSFWTHPMELLGEWVMANFVSVCLETVLVLVQDRSMVCAKRTIGSVIILYAPNGTPR